MILLFIAALVRISVPYVLAALGGTVSEKSGVTQIALEGMLLVGAFSCVVGADVTHSAAGGLVSGAIAGGVLALVYALVVLWLRTDQIVTGVALNLLADGITRYFLKVRYDSASNSPRIAVLAVSPSLLVVVTVVICAVVAFMLSRTVFGLRIRAVGEHPTAARTLGVDPRRVRLYALLIGGLLAGAGGAYLAAQQRQFISGMSAGRGYIALAAMIFGRWRPWPAVLACLLFAAAEAFEIRMQTSGGLLPGWAVQMLPYLLTLVVIALAKGNARAPAALGK